MSENGDKRKVSTDALETLGKIIDENEKRDAIHLAVVPTQATWTIRPGQHVNANGSPWMEDRPFVGIVDPFLECNVEVGEWFWLVLYPRQITSLRHVWTHPAFPDSDVGYLLELKESQKIRKEAFKWIEEYGKSVGVNPKILLSAAEEYLRSGEFLDIGDNFYYLKLEFWDHFEIVTGKTVHYDKRGDFFTCSC